jgi:hypothetical protein
MRLLNHFEKSYNVLIEQLPFLALLVGKGQVIGQRPPMANAREGAGNSQPQLGGESPRQPELAGQQSREPGKISCESFRFVFRERFQLNICELAIHNVY